MSTIQHKSLKDELLYLIGRASAPLSSAELYEKCELADEMTKVAKAVANLQNDGKIVRVAGEGRARYKLAGGVATRAAASKVGPSSAVQKDDAAGLLTVGFPVAGIRPVPEPGLATLDIPTIGEPSAPVRPESGEGLPIDDKEIGKGLDQVERQLESERLADAIIARLKRQLAPAFVGMDAADGLDRIAVHIHIEQVDIHLGGL